MLLDSVNVCTELASVWRLVGRILFIFKIAIPVLIIVFGAIDFGKAVVASKSDEIKNAAKSLMFRALAGVFIFFVPALVAFIFTLVGDWGSEYENQYKVCSACIVHPGGNECTSAVSSSK